MHLLFPCNQEQSRTNESPITNHTFSLRPLLSFLVKLEFHVFYFLCVLAFEFNYNQVKVPFRYNIDLFYFGLSLRHHSILNIYHIDCETIINRNRRSINTPKLTIHTVNSWYVMMFQVLSLFAVVYWVVLKAIYFNDRSERPGQAISTGSIFINAFCGCADSVNKPPFILHKPDFIRF